MSAPPAVVPYRITLRPTFPAPSVVERPGFPIRRCALWLSPLALCILATKSVDVLSSDFDRTGMALFLYNVARVVFLGYFAALLVSFGLLLLPYLTNSRQLSYLDRLLLAFFLGAASLILLMFPLTALGWLYPVTGFAVSVPILVLAFPRWRSFCEEGSRLARQRWSRWRPDRLEQAALGSVTVGLLGVVLVLLGTRCLYPGETTGDCYEHYWPYLRAVVHGHGTAAGEAWCDYYTSQGSGLNFLAMLLTDDLACQSVTFLFLLASAALVFSLVRRLAGSDSWALLTTLVYLGAFPFSGSGWGGFHSHHVPAIAWMAAMTWLMVMPWCAERLPPKAWGIACFLIGAGFLVFCPMFMVLVLPSMGAYVGLLIALRRREWARPALGTLAGLVGALGGLLLWNYVVSGMPTENPTRVTWALADQQRFSRWCSPYLIEYFNEGSHKSIGAINSLNFSIRNVDYYASLFRLGNLRAFYPGHLAMLGLAGFLLGRWPLLRERLGVSWLALFPFLALFGPAAVVDVVVRIDASLYRNLVCLLVSVSVFLGLFWKLFFSCFSPAAARRLTALFMIGVWVPSLLRDATGGRETVPVEGATVRQVIDALDRLYPGVKERLCEGDGLRPGIAVAVDANLARLGLAQPVGEKSEVHFLPAIGGG